MGIEGKSGSFHDLSTTKDENSTMAFTMNSLLLARTVTSKNYHMKRALDNCSDRMRRLSIKVLVKTDEVYLEFYLSDKATEQIDAQ